MKVYDVIPFGEGQFLLRFWPVTDVLEQYEFGQYYATTCKIVLPDGRASLQDCVVRRERKPNFANVLVDDTYALVKSGLVAEALCSAAYHMTHVGEVISEADAIAWRKEPWSPGPTLRAK